MPLSAADEIIPIGATLGEGIVWDSRRAVLLWTDIQGKMLYRYDWTTGATQKFDTPKRLGSFGLVAGSGRLISAFESGIPVFTSESQAIEWLARPPEVHAGLRFNDGRVDRAGRFWSGTMVEDASGSNAGCLYSIDCTAGLRRHIRGVGTSNGLCVSPDGARLYFADSSTRTIWVYDFAEPEGTLHNARIFVRTPEGAYPDGATVDADGCVWSAHWGAGCVVRYTPAGTIERTVAVPTRQPTCPCFGGPGLDVLCITSASCDLDAPTLRMEPHAVDVFLYPIGTQGVPEPEYRL